jgi:hypothetical protein
MGLMMAPATDSIMGSVPAAQAGVGSAVNDTTRVTGGALGVAVLGSLFSSRYTSGLDALDGRVPPDALHAGRESIGAAVQAAQHLPHDVAPQFLHTAQTAFFDGMSLAAVVAAVIMACSAIVAALFLPARPSEGTSEPVDVDADGARRAPGS